MTYLEALKASLGYPLTDNAFILALENRGLTSTDTYSTTDKRAFELAKADCIMTLLSTPNVSEGGYSINLTDKESLKKLANGIYTRYKVANPLTPSASFNNPW